MYFCQEKSGLNFDGDSLKIHQGKHILYSNDRGTVMNLLYVSDAYATGLQYHQQYHQRTYCPHSTQKQPSPDTRLRDQQKEKDVQD